MWPLIRRNYHTKPAGVRCKFALQFNGLSQSMLINDRMGRRLLLLLISGLLAACGMQHQQPSINRFAGDSLMVRLADFQDRRLTDSLLHYCNYPETKYREAVLLALGSVQDSSAAVRVGEMLSDSVESVRIAASFALGQTRCLSSEQLLRDALVKEQNVRVRARLYESYGRTTRKWDFFELPTDTVESAGFAWGLFRAPADSVLNPLAAALLRSPATTVRLAAAHYFARKAPAPHVAERELLMAAQRDSNEEIRMAATLALRKVVNRKVLDVLSQILATDTSYRVRVNAVSALEGFKTADVLPLLLSTIKDTHSNVVIRAAEVTNSLHPDSEWRTVASTARKTTNFRAKALLYKAALAGSQDEDLFREMYSLYDRNGDPFHRAMLLSALAESFQALMLLHDELNLADTTTVRTAAAIATTSLNRKYPRRSKEFLNIYYEAIAGGDPAIVSVVCDALADPDLKFKTIINDWSFLTEARGKLRLPEDTETIQSLNAAIAYFEGAQPPSVKAEFNHPVDWALVRTINADQRAVIVTSKGSITVRLLVNDAPGTVASFVAMCQSGGYNNRSFHRVVPNFVAQGGCPRGDGFGSEDYSIRSEFSPGRYKTGSIGMASAGKDTESCQWFITHSPTPHLDGAYTIFAEVEKGMECVHALAVGDKILKIELLK